MRIGILGAGIAGLSSAYFLRETFPDLQIHEASTEVGGLARSFRWHDFDCDLAPHRLYTDNEELLRELLALVPMKLQQRKSRIYLRGKWIRDPVNALEIALKFFPNPSLHVMWKYLLRRRNKERSFEELVISKFGEGLNKLFFKPYSEKLFGIPASEISSEWGRRKIRVSGLRDMVQRRSKLYFKNFYYPVNHGYGAICTRLFEAVRDKVTVESRLVAIEKNARSGYNCTFSDAEGRKGAYQFDTVVSSLPVSYLSSLLGLQLNLCFRPALMIYLLIDRPSVTDNHWFYFADREFSVNRVAEFKNFASDGVPVDRTVLCCEVTEIGNDSTEQAITELVKTGLIKRSEVLDVKTITLPFAYPIYDRGYEMEMTKAKQFFTEHPNIHHVGRQARFEHKDVDEIFEEAKTVAELLIVLKGSVSNGLHQAVAG